MTKLELIESLKTRNDTYKLITPSDSICEIGVQQGVFFEVLLKSSPMNSYAVDIWDLYVKQSQNDLNYSIEQIRQYEIIFRQKFPNTKIFKMLSEDAVCSFSDNSLDFVYIDADHTYESVKQDINSWYPKVKSNGILAGHDYVEHIHHTKVEFGVVKAVNEFVKLNNIDNLHITSDDQWKSWYILKP